MSLLKDLYKTISTYEMLYFTTFYRFVINYRQTILGPLWVLVQPLAFILFLGALFTGLSASTATEFIPHLGIGYVAWTLLGGYLNRGPGIFNRNKPYIYDGNRSLTDAVVLDNLELAVQFAHRVFIIVGICIIFKTTNFSGVMRGALGLIIILLNGFFFSVILSIIAARFKDMNEVVTPLNSIFFLATPIIWMPGPPGTGGGKGQILSHYMNFNPFFHYLEIFRAPLLGQPVADLTLIFVAVTTVLGFVVSSILYARTQHLVPHWLN